MHPPTVLSRSQVVCWGATGQARVVREALAQAGGRIVVLVDNRELPSPFADIPIVYGLAGLRAWLAARSPAGLHGVAAVGGARGRERLRLLEQMQELGLLPMSVLHPRAFIAGDAQLGPAAQIMALAAVCANAVLGRGVIVNTAASVDHDCRLGDGVHVGPGARLCGEVEAGAGVFIGAGAIVLPRLRIGADAIVGAGAVVTRDVAAGVTVVGNPARVPRRGDG
jgi:sugar O-acyltransferase (sialic acid O-acetyltransferase NeuD family)